MNAKWVLRDCNDFIEISLLTGTKAFDKNDIRKWAHQNKLITQFPVRNYYSEDTDEDFYDDTAVVYNDEILNDFIEQGEFTERIYNEVKSID